MNDAARSPEIRDVNLEGTIVRLEPMSMEHHAALCAVGLDDDLWKVTTVVVRTPMDMEEYIRAALRQREAGTALPFVIRERTSGTIVGCTRYLNIDAANRRVEIGATWVGRRWQRTAVNTETKYLLLRHAFDVLRCIRVEFKTDLLNTRSQEALRRIGAKEEGILRSHMIVAGGRIRDTVYFSIIAEEWPAVKALLEAKLRR